MPFTRSLRANNCRYIDMSVISSTVFPIFISGSSHLRVDPHGGRDRDQLGRKGVVMREDVAGFVVAMLLVARRSRGGQ